ncbi:uncharacterized protein LOC134834884 [Culicoides brevitarsis]|uniref:uncharacterized protein LOC134834884 n=1 Tax=Culicoides brevitarsis TaxID=469753 RepID=UPI00307B9CC4
MPDYSNEDLVKLIHRVINKVNTLEDKIDQVLIELKNNQQTKQAVRFIHRGEEGFEDLDFDFKFTPIGSEEELAEVTQTIENDPQYRKKLLAYISSKGNFTIEHLFTDVFLFDYNLSGANGKRKLEGIVPFEQIYMYLKMKESLTEDEIKRELVEKLTKIKNRVYKRRSLQQKRTATPAQETHFEEQRVAPRYKIEEQIVVEDPIEEVQEEEEDLSHETYTEPGQIFIEETIEHEMPYHEYDEEYAFSPINSDADLEAVTQKIRNNPQYLKQLRLHLVNESDNGQITLEQLFTVEYLQDFNLYGRQDNRKLADLVPYKALYFYLKKHTGLDLKQIELDASNELKRLKNRMAARRKVQRKRGELPPVTKKEK